MYVARSAKQPSAKKSAVIWVATVNKEKSKEFGSEIVWSYFLI